MYVDSANDDFPAGMQTVAKTLREYVEPLLMVCVHCVVHVVVLCPLLFQCPSL